MGKWIEINLPFGPIWGNEWKKKDSFSERKLNKPGVLVKMEDGKQYLIGHINKNRGICDDCVAFDNHDIVVKYKVLVDINE